MAKLSQKKVTLFILIQVYKEQLSHRVLELLWFLGHA